MNDNLFYVINKNKIRENIEMAQINMPLTLNTVIDGRCEFYGMGNDVVSVVDKCKINYVLVNNLKEAISLRKYHNDVNIIIKYIDKEYIYDALVNDFVITVYSYKQLEEIKELNLKDDLRVMLYVDVENNIEGFKSLEKISDYLTLMKHLQVLGTFSEINFDKKGKKFEQYSQIIEMLPKNYLHLIISDKLYDVNVNYFSKSMYLKDIDQIVSLCGNIKFVRKFKKGDFFLNKILKREKYFAMINTPYKMGIKKVYIKGKIYKVYDSLDNYLIVEVNDSVKVKTRVELLGKNFVECNENVLLKSRVMRKYLDGSMLEETRFL